MFVKNCEPVLSANNPAVAKLAGYFYCRTALKVVGIDKGVETALKEGFHPQKVNPTLPEIIEYSCSENNRDLQHLVPTKPALPR